MGITLREVVFEIGGGVAKDRKFKAVLVSGPFGRLPSRNTAGPAD